MKKHKPIPRGATHVRLFTLDRKKAFDEVKNIDCYQGCPGKLTFLKKTREKFIELGSIEFDGVWPPKEEEEDTPRLVT